MVRAAFTLAFSSRDAVADAYAETLAAILIAAFAYKAGTFGSRALVHILLKKLLAKADKETFV